MLLVTDMMLNRWGAAEGKAPSGSGAAGAGCSWPWELSCSWYLCKNAIALRVGLGGPGPSVPIQRRLPTWSTMACNQLCSESLVDVCDRANTALSSKNALSKNANDYGKGDGYDMIYCYRATN